MSLSSKKHSRPLFILYMIVIYVMLQMGWWTYMLIDVNHVYFQQQIDNSTLWGNSDSFELATKMLHRKIWMIIGETSVFVGVLAFGITQMRISVKKEIALARQQNNFMLAITHELKSPIAAIKLQLQTVQKHKLDDKIKNELVQKGIQDTDRLNDLVEKILVAARLDDEKLSIIKKDGDLSEFVKNKIATLMTFAGRNHQTLTDVQENIAFSFDKHYMDSIIVNLYENAAKYSPKNTTIEVHLTKKNNLITLTVSDEGKGVLPENRNKIFMRFFREENEETMNTKGTGLGLFIVKNLVALHQGTVAVEQHLPVGSTFIAKFQCDDTA